MERFWLMAGLVAAAGVAAAQNGPVVTARDDAPVELTEEDRQAQAEAQPQEQEPQAQEEEKEEEGRFYLGVGVGGMRVHRAASPAPGTDLRGVQPSVTLRLGYDFADSPWSLEAFGSFARANRKSGSDAARAIYGLGAEALWHFDRYARFDPFLAGGLSYYGGNAAPLWQDGQRAHFFAQAGVGAFFHLTETLSLRGDLRWHVGLTDDFLSFSTADVGLTWFVGGDEEESADTVQPLAPAPRGELEPGAQRYDEASAHAEKLRDVTPIGAGDAMHLELRVGFAKDTAVIQPSEYPVMDELARMVLAAFEINPQAQIEIHGHADRQHGSDHAYNQELSEARAKSVMNLLAQNGAPVARMTAVGHSFDQPLQPVDLDKGTPANRRVEIVINGVTEAERERIRAGK